MNGDVLETKELELLASISPARWLAATLMCQGRALETMCDCAEYEFEEMALETEEKEPVKIAVPLQLVRAKKK